MTYVTAWDENGDDVVTLDEEAWRAHGRLPRNYRAREVALAAQNIANGHDRSELAISRNVLHLGVQRFWDSLEDWGQRAES